MSRVATTGDPIAVEFRGTPGDRWHRWTVVEGARNARTVTDLLFAKGVDSVRLVGVSTPAAPHWRARREERTPNDDHLDSR